MAQGGSPIGIRRSGLRCASLSLCPKAPVPLGAVLWVPPPPEGCGFAQSGAWVSALARRRGFPSMPVCALPPASEDAGFRWHGARASFPARRHGDPPALAAPVPAAVRRHWCFPVRVAQASAVPEGSVSAVAAHVPAPLPEGAGAFPCWVRTSPPPPEGVGFSMRCGRFRLHPRMLVSPSAPAPFG